MSFKGLLRQVGYGLQQLQELVYPRSCTVCGVGISEGCFCKECRKEYLLQAHHSYQLSEEWRQLRDSGLQLLAEDLLTESTFLFKYDGVIKELLQILKFDDRSSILPYLQEEVRLALPAGYGYWLSGYDVVTCIPTAKERRERRGYDVPQELFACLWERTGHCQYRPQLLERIKHTDPLFDLDAETRKAMLAGCFGMGERFDLRGKRVLLCDDIFTTGSTITEAAMVLKEQGAKDVSCLTFAAAKSNWE